MFLFVGNNHSFNCLHKIVKSDTQFLCIFQKSTNAYFDQKYLSVYEYPCVDFEILHSRHNFTTCRCVNVCNGSSYPVTEIGKSKRYNYFIKPLVWLQCIF